ncbi:hypothetical protein HaLaN_17613 [Haematococcus lacustris]|uniref:Uncharacterized protein n=1 Tax=Haematococcus lacustris TaxID=44745 RepID=A0A699ZP18_HAELA|nr:hypothetical protein HaLaN_17613 [Haematococcus lacustris]
MQRPLELCSYEGLEAQPPVGEEYQQGYKLVNDRLPKGRQRLHRAAKYRGGYWAQYNWWWREFVSTTAERPCKVRIKEW